MDCDEPEDQRLVSLHGDLFVGKRDVSELDSEYHLVLASEVPETILQTTGHSNVGFTNVFYYWNFYDVNYLLKGSQPAEAVPIVRAGFSEDDLISLAKSDRYLSYIRLLERYAKQPHGHYFPVELEEQLMAFERKHSAGITLRRKLLELRAPRFDIRPDNPSAQVSEKMRNEVLKYHSYSCIFDGRTRPEFPIHVHHVIPRRLIKQLSLPELLFTARENLVASCGGCNIVKSDQLSKADVLFYLSQFSVKDHPNNALLPFIERVRAFQQDDFWDDRNRL